MSGFQVLTLVASLLGVVATVLNLVAFVREKDKSHTRAGLGFLFLLMLVLGIGFLPGYAPHTAARLVSSMPEAVAITLRPWLESGRSRGAMAVEMDSSGLLGSFTIEIHRNLLGGIGALVSNFQFSNPSQETIRVTAYHVRITRKAGEAPRSYDRVLTEPVVVGPQGTEKAQVELDAEIRDQWVAREDLAAAERGSIEISWDCQEASGRQFRLTSSNG